MVFLPHRDLSVHTVIINKTEMTKKSIKLIWIRTLFPVLCLQYMIKSRRRMKTCRGWSFWTRTCGWTESTKGKTRMERKHTHRVSVVCYKKNTILALLHQSRSTQDVLWLGTYTQYTCTTTQRTKTNTKIFTAMNPYAQLRA